MGACIEATGKKLYTVTAADQPEHCASDVKDKAICFGICTFSQSIS